MYCICTHLKQSLQRFFSLCKTEKFYSSKVFCYIIYMYIGLQHYVKNIECFFVFFTVHVTFLFVDNECVAARLVCRRVHNQIDLREIINNR